MRHVTAGGLLVLALGLAGCPDTDDGPDFGRFVGRLLLEPVGDGLMELQEDWIYVDVDGKRWKAHEGYRSDGASIPRALWTFVGAPFTGDYVKAAAVHDVYCEAEHRTGETWQQVHEMFYRACRCAGVEEWKAKVLYGAVYRFGPRWADDGTEVVAKRLPRPVPPPGPRDDNRTDAPWLRYREQLKVFQEREEHQQRQVEALRDWIRRENPTLEAIRKRELE